MGLMSFFRRANPDEQAAQAIYVSIVAQARNMPFYSVYGVPDSVDGRFDMIVLHAMLVMRRLRAEAEATKGLAQALFDYMFDDMDRSLREIGVGDMSVGKHIKKMAKAFYGRASECEAGLDGSEGVMSDALKRTLYRSATPTDAQIAAMSRYLRHADAALAKVSSTDMRQAHLAWTVIDTAV